MAKQLAFEAFPRWDARHPGGGCPTLDDLLPFVGSNGRDPWGDPYRLACSERGLHVWSSGPDGRSGTADDVTSHDVSPR